MCFCRSKCFSCHFMSKTEINIACFAKIKSFPKVRFFDKRIMITPFIYLLTLPDFTRYIFSTFLPLKLKLHLLCYPPFWKNEYSLAPKNICKHKWSVYNAKGQSANEERKVRVNMWKVFVVKWNLDRSIFKEKNLKYKIPGDSLYVNILVWEVCMDLKKWQTPAISGRFGVYTKRSL